MKVDTKAIRARADAATEGPWLMRQPTPGDKEIEFIGPDNLRLDYDDVNHTHQLDDGRFIAAARTDVPALCDRVEHLEAALRDALALYSDPDATSEAGYARYRRACAVLEGE